MAKQPRQPETPAKRLASLFRQAIRENAEIGREELPPRRPLREPAQEAEIWESAAERHARGLLAGALYAQSISDSSSASLTAFVRSECPSEPATGWSWHR
jgi:hypothetical protein